MEREGEKKLEKGKEGILKRRRVNNRGNQWRKKGGGKEREESEERRKNLILDFVEQKPLHVAKLLNNESYNYPLAYKLARFCVFF